MADLTITASQVALVRADEDGILTAPTSEAITAGQVVRLDSANGRFMKADASAANTSRARGIALRSVGAGEALTICTRGIVDLGDALDALGFDTVLFLSDTDGTVADAAGTTSVQLGHVIGGFAVTGTADKLFRVLL